uniref:Uncharacterized protein n=1 Tax=Saimiri boliviensis boliviensis TaxID=39432 RepID=A0A2K6S996_SAIBB
MTQPPASTSGITGTLSLWNLKILQINQLHLNAVKFENFEDAALEENNLAVIGVFLKDNSQSPLKK